MCQSHVEEKLGWDFNPLRSEATKGEKNIFPMNGLAGIVKFLFTMTAKP
jgi:hypothetical protein